MDEHIITHRIFNYDNKVCKEIGVMTWNNY